MFATTDLTTFPVSDPRVAPVAAVECDTQLGRFLRAPPKSTFKALIVNSALRHKLTRMSNSKAVPEGLKDQECEKGSRARRPPIPYVPVIDPVQEIVNSQKEHPMKIKLPDKTEIQVPIWHSGTPEAFLIHVREALSACKRKGYFSKYSGALDSIVKSEEAIRLFGRAVQKEKKTAAARQAVAVKKTSTKTKTVSEDATLQVEVAEEQSDSSVESDLSSTETVTEEAPLTQSQKDLELARTTKKNAERLKTLCAKHFFSLYANLLSEDARFQWDKIVSSQVDTAPWTDLQGEEHEEARAKSYTSFTDCVTMHLQTVFPEDAAERQRLYISNVLKKPQRVPVRYFFQRLEQLNSYLSHLPGTYDSPRANTATRKIESYDEAELAEAALRMVPESWQDQYMFQQDSVAPTSMRKLLAVLENIEKMMENQAAKEKVKSAKPESKTGSEKPNKRRGMSSSADRIPKKAKSSDKFCQLCKEYGGPHKTHNTSDCRKYEKDGTKKKFGKSGKFQKSDGNSYANMQVKLEKLEKLVKRTAKKHSRKRKRRDDSDDSDSDYE